MIPTVRRRNNGLSNLFLGLAVVATACVDAPPDDGDVDGVEAESSALFFNTSEPLWNNNALGTRATIPVCFRVRPLISQGGAVECPNQTTDLTDCDGQVLSAAANTLIRHRIREAAETVWSRQANVEFTGWGNCPTERATCGTSTDGCHRETSLPARLVIVLRSNPDPNIGGDGVNRYGRSNTLPTLMQTWHPNLTGTPLIMGSVVHEIGHVLGFDHEWLHRDFPPGICNSPEPRKDGQNGRPNTNNLSWADRRSRMQYCATGGLGSESNTITLSPGDVVGVQRAYGRKPSGSVVGYRGMCASIAGGSTADQTRLVAGTCRGDWNDRFFRDLTANRQWFRTASNDKCMNVEFGQAPGRVVSWPCQDVAHERFTTTGVEWRALGNMCLQATLDKIRLATCDGSSSQKWDFFSSANGLRQDQIRNVLHGTCVTAATTPARGQELTLTKCSATAPTQRFAWLGFGLIAPVANSSVCANVEFGRPDDGSRLILWNDCSATPGYNSQFTLSGKIKSLGSCLTIGDSGLANPGDTIRVQGCSSSPLQTWEYFL